jgi:hypothetical protein
VGSGDDRIPDAITISDSRTCERREQAVGATTIVSADEDDKVQTMPLFGRNNDVDLLIVDQNATEPLPWTIETTIGSTRQSTRRAEQIRADGTDDIGNTMTPPPSDEQSNVDTTGYGFLLKNSTITATGQWHAHQTKKLLTWIEKAITWKPMVPFDESSFKFEVTMEAAWHNYRVLE